MTRFHPRIQLLASLALAVAGLWLFFGDRFEVADLSFAFVGAWLFVVAAWVFVGAVHRIPPTDAEQAIAPGEWQAWIGAVFLGAVLVAMALAGDAFSAPVPVPSNPDAMEAGQRIAMLFVAWLVLAWVLRQRWKGAVVEDERDRRIEQVADGWGRMATTFLVVGIAVMLGFSPSDRLQSYSYPFLAHLLVFSLVWGAWFDRVVATVLYWRDRRAWPA